MTDKTEPFTINGVQLIALAVCAATEKMRYDISCVRLRPTADKKGTVLEATDGRILARLNLDTTPAPGDYAFPLALVKRFKADDVIEVEKGVATIRDLMMRVDLLPPGAYPTTDDVIPAATREGSPVIGAGEPFGQAFAVLKKLGVDGCRFGIGKPNEAVLITASTLYGRLEIAVMPLDSEDEATKKRLAETVAK